MEGWLERLARRVGPASLRAPPSLPPCPAQVVDEVFDRVAARKMGIDQVGQVCIMIHSGSRGLGHQVGWRGGGPAGGGRCRRARGAGRHTACNPNWPAAT